MLFICLVQQRLTLHQNFQKKHQILYISASLTIQQVQQSPKDELQKWVDYANKVGAVIIYDAAYEAYISEPDVPHTIYECEGARTCAIELRSFSKNAGFTGVRLGFTVIPKDLKCGDVTLHSLWARRHGTKFNGAPYIVQRAGEAVYSEAGQKQTGEQIAYYMNNAKTILKDLSQQDIQYQVVLMHHISG